MDIDLQQLHNRPRQQTYKRLFSDVHVDEWPDPVDPEEGARDYVEERSHKKRPDLWQWNKENEDWELKDADENWWYQWYKKQVDKYDADLNWKQTRHKPSVYEEIKEQIEHDGLPNVTLQPQYTGNLISLRVTFPSNFVHLTNEVGQRKKEQQDSGYHISMGYIKDYDSKKKLEKASRQLCQQIL